MVEVDTTSLIEKDVCGAGDDLVLLCALPYLMIIKVIPVALIIRVRRVMPSAELPLVIRDGEEVVQGAIRWTFT